MINSDSQVWNLGEVVQAITFAKSTKQDLEMDLNAEGPDFKTLGLLEYIGDWDFRTTVVTENAVQAPLGKITFKHRYTGYNVKSTYDGLKGIAVQKNIRKPFGLFVGRSNLHRLYISSYLYERDIANQTFHYDSTVNFHRNNLGLDKLIELYGTKTLAQTIRLLENCPIIKQEQISYPILPEHHNNLYAEYENFFAEIICETMFTGRTFFPTEKTWRAIMLETPFIIQGGQWFLHRLRSLGFQTFDQWWDEGYAEDPADHQPHEIVKVIDHLGQKSIAELNKMYLEMKPILNYNKQRFMELKSTDFEIFKNDQY